MVYVYVAKSFGHMGTVCIAVKSNMMGESVHISEVHSQRAEDVSTHMTSKRMM
jgi:hypothetical protein